MAQLNTIRLGQPNLTQRVLTRRGFGLVGGLDIPDDLVETAGAEGAVIVFYRDAIAQLAPATILAANPSGDGEGFAVVDAEAARAAELVIVYDPLLGTRAPRRASGRTLLAVSLGTLVVGGALWFAFKG